MAVLSSVQRDSDVWHSGFKNKWFKPRQALNIRKGPGIRYERLKQVLNTDDQVRASGKSFGDWWEVKPEGSTDSGWVNSLWLVPVEGG